MSVYICFMWKTRHPLSANELVHFSLDIIHVDMNELIALWKDIREM